MPFTYHHLDEDDVRAAMVRLWNLENEQFIVSGRRAECYGADLLEVGWVEWEHAMPLALGERDDEWLVEQMSEPAFWRPTREFLRAGKPIEQRVNVEHVAGVLGRGEFNTAYVRGLASALLERGESECLVYRADRAYQPRPECLALEGRTFPLQDLLAGHRARYWPPENARPDVLSIPTGFGCHHSICALTAAAETPDPALIPIDPVPPPLSSCGKHRTVL
jgi:hypothetical protein